MLLRFTCLFAVLGALACAQPGSVAGPSTGYVFDPASKVVRQIRGIPGAAILGQPVDFGMAIAGATVSPRGDFAVVVAADGGLHLFRLADGGAKEVMAQNVIGAPTRIVFSPSGTAIGLYAADNIQILTGLPDSVTVGHVHPIPSPEAPEAAAAAAVRRPSVGSMAISDDGVYVLVARQQSVVLSGFPGSQRTLASTRGRAMLAFAPNGHDAAVVSGGTLSVYQDVAGASTRQDFPNASASAGVAFSADGARVLLAGLRGVTILNRATGTASAARCECHIAGLTAMGALFRLNDPGADPLWLLDPATAEPRLVFVPASAN